MSDIGIINVTVKGKPGTLIKDTNGSGLLMLENPQFRAFTHKSTPDAEIKGFPGGAFMRDIIEVPSAPSVPSVPSSSSAPSVPSSSSAPSVPSVPSVPSAPSTSIDFQLNFRPTGRRSYDINTSATRPTAGTFIPIPQMDVRPMESVSDLAFLQARPTRGPKLVL